MSVKIIHITGASGSGTTTLAKAIAREFGFTHLDTDDFFWLKTDPPFTRKRDPASRRLILEKAINEAETCVISGSLTEWGDEFIPRFDLVIYVTAPTAVRIERLKEREYRELGERILEHGDMYENHQSFLRWAAEYDHGGLNMRSAAHHRMWLQQITCPVRYVDGTAPICKILSELPL